MKKIKFEKEKIEKAIKAVNEMCIGCEQHSDECPIVKITEQLKKL